MNNFNYNKLTPFKWFILENFPFIEADFDALTEWQLFCKLGKEMNKIITSENVLGTQMENVTNAFIELENYVNNYFNNLDVQDEINNKLNEMAEDGTLSSLLAPYLETFNQRLDSQDDKLDAQDLLIEAQNTAIQGQNETISDMTANLQQEKEERQDADGLLETQISNIVASAGTAGESSSEIVQARTNVKSITFPALNDRINYIENTTPFKSQTVQNTDLNNLLDPKNYFVYGTVSNVPSITGLDFSTNTAYVIVEGLNPERDSSTGAITHYRALVQRYYPYYTSSNRAFRGFFTRLIKWDTSTSAYIYETWNMVAESFIQAIFQPDNKIYRFALSEAFAGNNSTSNQTDLNTLLIQGNWLLTNANNINTPTGLSVGFVHNEVTIASSNKWVMQTFSTAQGDAIYQRMIFARANDPIYYEWKKIYPVESCNISLTGKKIVNFGDSIFGNFQGTTSVSQNIANITGATVYNVGFGGCQMSDRNDTGWKAFSMCNLATAVASQDFTTQDATILDPPSGMPAYFSTHLATLKSIDFSEVDIVTISYGTNDYTAGDLLDNESDLKDIDTFAGALRYSIETLLTAYPNLKIVIGTPLFRLWLNDGVIEATSDTRTYAGNYTLIDMTNKVKEIGQTYHCQVIDAYNDFGVNEFNWERIFDSTDTTHPTSTGRALLGRLYGIELLK